MSKSRSFAAWSTWIPALVPRRKNDSKSLVLEALNHDRDCKASRYTLQPMQAKTSDAVGGRLIAILPPKGREASYRGRRRREAFSDDAIWPLDECRPEIQCGPRKILRTNAADSYFLLTNRQFGNSKSQIGISSFRRHVGVVRPLP